jgi:uncharacterized membrane protein
MHTAERWLSSIGGGVLTLYGLLRRDRPGWALAAAGGVLTYRGMSGHSYLYQGIGIDTSGRELPPSTSVPDGYGIKVEKAVTIARPAHELYQFWRHFENLPRIMEHLKEVKVLDETHSYWVVKAPAGKEVAWDAEIINDREDELIAWRSLPGARIPNAGSVHFTPATGGRGTVVRVVLEYAPPAGRPGALFAKLFGEEPEQQVREDLRHFKEIMEAGEIPTTTGQPTGRRKLRIMGK